MFFVSSTKQTSCPLPLFGRILVDRLLHSNFRGDRPRWGCGNRGNRSSLTLTYDREEDRNHTNRHRGYESVTHSSRECSRDRGRQVAYSAKEDCIHQRGWH